MIHILSDRNVEAAVVLPLATVTTLLACLAAAPSVASGFSEDLCVQRLAGDRRRFVNCLDATTCGFPGDGDLCRANLVWDSGKAIELAARGAARSMVHVDATYFIAQAVGFSPEASYWIAAYDELADTAAYSPFGSDGRPVDSWRGMPTNTASLNGWMRLSEESGGFMVHMFAPYVPQGSGPFADGACDGEAPDIGNPVCEGMLYHARAWAMGQRDACADGYTTLENGNPYLGAACFQQDDRLEDEPWLVNPHVLVLAPPLQAEDEPDDSILMRAYSGDQIARFTPAESPADAPGDYYISDVEFVTALPALLSETYSLEELDAILRGRTISDLDALVRIGIYLHMVQDRISHNECGDRSSTHFDPAAQSGEGAFVVTYDEEACSAGNHAYTHYQEQATGAMDLPPRTLSALRYTWQELASFREALPALSVWLRPDAPDPVSAEIPDELLEGLDAALRTPDACRRNRAMMGLLAQYGYAQMPGNSLSPATACR